MSHFTTVKTKIADRECLKIAIRELGYEYEENRVEINGYQAKKIRVDLAIKSDGGTHDIGFKWNGDTYDIVADWWQVERDLNIKQNTFIPQLTQKYAYHKTKEVLAEKGFVLAGEEINNRNEIVLTVRQW